MKISLGISNFLEEISSLSHSIVFLCFFALIPEKGFLISPCYSLELAFKWVYLSFSPLFSLPFFSQLFVRPPQTAIAGKNINNLRYADDSTLMAESEEELLKSLLMKVKKESEKAGLKLNIQKTKIMASGPITSWEIDGETVETVSDFIFGGLQNHCRW